MLLKFREVEVFWAVYRTQSMKAAARSLNVSQPAISMTLKSAEQRFGIRLFERVGSRIKPTPEAHALFSASNNVFIELEEFKRQLTRIQEGRGGMVSIGATPTLAAAFVHPALAAFRRAHPEVRIVVRTATTDHNIDMVAQGRVDLAVAYGPTGTAAADTEDICVAEVACVLRSDHPLTARSLIRPGDLRAETLLTYRPDTPLGREIQKTLRDAGADLKIAVEATALTAAYLANSGFGVALVDPFILNGGLFNDLTMRPFEPTTRARIQILTRRDEPLAAVSRDFLGEIRNCVPKQFSLAVPVRAWRSGGSRRS